MGGISRTPPTQSHQLLELRTSLHKKRWFGFITSAGFHVLFFQVSFRSYMPTYYTSEDAGDYVDGYVFTKAKFQI